MRTSRVFTRYAAALLAAGWILDLPTTTDSEYRNAARADFITDLVGWYTFNPGEELLDRTATQLGDGNASDLANAGGVFIAGGIATFDGSATDYLTASEQGGELHPTGNGWTIWARIRQPGSDGSTKQSIVDRIQGGVGGYHLRLDDGLPNKLRGAIQTNAALRNSQSDANAVPVNQFTELAFVWNAPSSVMELFVDGNVAMATSVSSSETYAAGTSPMTIGARADTLGDLFTGAIDEARLYDRALGTSDINSIEAVDPSSEPPISSPAFVGTQVGTVESDQAVEISGMAASHTNPDVLWYHNDSGDAARALAMNTQGDHLGIYNLSGISAEDWEDMAVGPGPAPGQQYLYLGDIGGNADANIRVVRPDVLIQRVAEPTVAPDQSPVVDDLTGVETLNLVYPDGGEFDSETLMVDPDNGDIYIVSKDRTGAGVSHVFRSAAPHTPGVPTTMEEVAVLQFGTAGLPVNNKLAAGGDISVNGDEVIIKTLTDAFLWERPDGAPLWDAFSQTAFSIPLFAEPQGESITFDGNGEGYYTVTEKPVQPLYYFARVVPGVFHWTTDGVGDWNVQGNWTPSSGSPSTNEHTAVFGESITTPTTVVTNDLRTVNRIEFDSALSYAIGGLGSVNLEADGAGGLPSVQVYQGSHQFQAIVNLRSTTDVIVESGASLAMNNALNLNGNDLLKTGAGTLAINNSLDSGSGSVHCLEGVCSGMGTVGGDLINDGGTVSPGHSPGSMEVRGDYSQTDESVLLIELAGTEIGSEYDVLRIDGEVALGGTLEVVLLDSFEPDVGSTFDILTAGIGITGTFTTRDLPLLSASHLWDVIYGGNVVTLAVTEGVELGDMDCDGDVDFDDIDDFVFGLNDPDGYEAEFGVPPSLKGDTDGDGDHDFDDIDDFVAILNAPLTGGVQGVPEPSTVLLAVIGLLVLVGCYRPRRPTTRAAAQRGNDLGGLRAA